MFGNINLMEIVYMIVPIVLALSVHEYFHALSANMLGDPTASINGRLTLDPTKHVDPIGLIMLFLFGFGWARPVPINPMNFKNRKMGTLIVSLAGPVSNFVLAMIFALLFRVFAGINNEIFMIISTYGVSINIYFGVFNLLPIPPLDGSKILASLLPNDLERLFYKYEQPIYFILIFLIIFGVLSPFLNIIASPLINLAQLIMLG